MEKAAARGTSVTSILLRLPLLVETLRIVDILLVFYYVRWARINEVPLCCWGGHES